MHKKQKFDSCEPNPWTWKVWTEIQQEKNNFKQLISFTHSNHHNHSHSHMNHSNSCQHAKTVTNADQSYCTIV